MANNPSFTGIYCVQLNSLCFHTVIQYKQLKGVLGHRCFQNMHAFCDNWQAVEIAGKVGVFKKNQYRVKMRSSKFHPRKLCLQTYRYLRKSGKAQCSYGQQFLVKFGGLISSFILQLFATVINHWGKTLGWFCQEIIILLDLHVWQTSHFDKILQQNNKKASLRLRGKQH